MTYSNSSSQGTPVDQDKLDPFIDLINGNSVVVTPTGVELPENDSEMAEAFKKATDLKILYVIETQHWYIWDGKVWSKDKTSGAVIRNAISEYIRKWPVRKEAIGRMNSFLNTSRLKSVQQTLADKVLMHRNQLDADPRLITFSNGVLNIDTGELQEYDPNLYLTQMLDFGYYSEIEEGKWSKFIKQILPDPDVRRAAQSLYGYTLLVEGNPARKIIFNIGPTSTGKSTMNEAIGYALPSFCRAFGLPMFRDKHGEGPRQDIIDALPYRMIHCSEATSGFEWHSDSIKRMTGEDTITARAMYGRETVARHPSFTPIVATNDMPTIKGADRALRRRLIAIPFMAQIAAEREEYGLSRKLGEDCASEIFNWLLEGYKDYRQNGLAFAEKVFKVSSDDAYTDAANSSFAAFMEEVLDVDPEAYETNSAVNLAYEIWCDSNGHKEKLSSVQVGREFSKLGWQTVQKKVPENNMKNGRVRFGYRIKDEYRNLLFKGKK